MKQIRLIRLSHFPKQPNPVAFELTVTGPDGKTAVDTVDILAVPDNLRFQLQNTEAVIVTGESMVNQMYLDLVSGYN